MCCCGVSEGKWGGELSLHSLRKRQNYFTYVVTVCAFTTHFVNLRQKSNLEKFDLSQRPKDDVSIVRITALSTPKCEYERNSVEI